MSSPIRATFVAVIFGILYVLASPTIYALEGTSGVVRLYDDYKNVVIEAYNGETIVLV